MLDNSLVHRYHFDALANMGLAPCVAEVSAASAIIMLSGEHS